MIAKIKLYLIFAGLGAVFSLITNALVAYNFYQRGAKAESTKCENAKTIATEEKLTVKEKQDEIQNAPIDTVVTNRRLHNETF